MMDENLIVEKFREIKELGFVKSKPGLTVRG